MSCGSCVSTLSGFGQEEIASDIDVSPELVSGMKTSLGLLVGVPVAGSVVGAIGGAVGWQAHRVIGGVLGWVAGGAIGGVVGSLLAKRTIAQQVLPEIEEVAAQIEASQPGTIGMQAQANSAGPLSLPADVVAEVVGKSLGMGSHSATVQAAQAVVSSVQKSAPASGARINARISMLRRGAPATHQIDSSPMSTMPLRTPVSIPRLPLTKFSAQPALSPKRPSFPTTGAASTTSAKSSGDASVATTKLAAGDKMPFPTM